MVLATVLGIGMLGNLWCGCEPEWSYMEDAEATLKFSADTVAFDTVFAQMGTTTRQVKVYNRYSEALKIDAVTLRGGRASHFRINVDGDTSTVVHNIEIAGKDSIFIFIQALIDPTDATTPFLVEDAIVFSFNGKQQELPLTAYGRNAVYHVPTAEVQDQYGNRYPYSVIDCANWDHTRPHVIFGFAVVDEGTTLHLQGGDELYFGTESYLWVYDGGTLDVRGAQGNEVLFSSLRHDGWYDSLPGQWGYIWLSTGSKDNHIEWARIENGTAGIVADTNVNGNPTLSIDHSVIENHSLSGMVCQGAYVVGDNLLIDNCGSTVLSLQYGGRYRFTSCTFANYWYYDSRKAPAVVLNNYYVYNGDTLGRPLTSADFDNCIIYGTYTGRNNEGELLLDHYRGSSFEYALRHCLIKTGQSDDSDPRTHNVIWNEDPLFVDARSHDLHLQGESPAIGAGDATALRSLTDLDGNPRGNPPTLGAYEYAGGDSRAYWTDKSQKTYHKKTNTKTNNTNSLCTTTLGDGLRKPHRPTQSWTVAVWGTSWRSASTPIRRLKISQR